MTERIKKSLTNPLVKGSLVLFISGIISNLAAYLYHLVSGRFLTPADYGLLESLISLTYFLNVLTATVGFVFVIFFATLKEDEISTNLCFLKKKFDKSATAFCLLLILFYPVFNKFLRIASFPIFLIFILQNLFGFFVLLYNSLFQARLKFSVLAFLTIVASFSRVVFPLVFLSFGAGTQGVLAGGALSAAVNFFLAKMLAAKLFRKGGKEIVKQKLNFLSYSLLSFFANIGLISLYTTDILFVRYYFSGVESGVYSSVSVLGKMIFFGASIILTVVFPMFIREKRNIFHLRKIFMASFSFILLISFAGTIVFKIFPELIVKLLYGNNYKDAYLYLPQFAVFISLVVIFNLFVQFLLALAKKSAPVLSLATAALQIVLMIKKHGSISELIKISTVSVFLGLTFSSLPIIFSLLRKGERQNI